MTDAPLNETHRRRLGRGLSSLLGGAAPAAEEVEQTTTLELQHVPVDRIERNPYQPRKEFNAEALTELAASIREHGVLQPPLVRELGEGFQLVAGERRWLAAKKAGLTTIPCRVIDVVDKTACEVALEENLKRTDLTDIEKAHAFRTYLDHFQCSIEELSKQLSMSRSAVSNMLRLLELPDPVKRALQDKKISAGHARALLTLGEPSAQLALCGRVQAESLSVRDTEAAAKELLRQRHGEPPATEVEEAAPAQEAAGEAACEAPAGDGTIPIDAPADDHRSNHIASLEQQLAELLSAKVEIRLKSKDSGTITIPFGSNDEFERILGALRRRAA
ncbi:MAG: ParB/RepB/Spo0J family partition protein [Planctomycetota bacterium]|nr:MAG: ParB/RepB/Spo0J family partition protein [Planctomycetota bacterium]REK25891.1 MAG: ParB/RepB/Spo0J family partition protein [Planctomycetota bacterium]REK37170.1 MAG: ParB/RepB/Spo0J family partition protein [Planctomycetota bacterium]